MAAETKRLTASERDALVRMNIALEILCHEGEALKARTRLIPGGPRDMGMLAAKVLKLMQAFTATVPAEQLPTYRRALQMVSYTVGIKSPGKLGRDDKNYGIWLPNEVLGTLAVACHDHCVLCDLDKVGRKQCPLRKALDIIPNDVRERYDGDCPYYTIL